MASRKRTTVAPRSSSFDRNEARRAVGFAEEYCRHVKGERARERLVLEPWQRDLVEQLFGWKRPDGTRKHRFLWLEVPRKAGKTSLAAAVGLYMLMCDPERGAEIVVAAGDADQAGICFAIARQMVEADLDLSAVCKLYRRSIVYKDGYFQVISAKHETKHGANISCLILDEVHVQPTRDLHDTLITSMGARRQPLVLYITTAGYDRASLCWELHDYACKVRDGIVDDPSWLVRIFAADPEADWTDAAVWRKAHPGLGVSVAETFLAQECERAKGRHVLGRVGARTLRLASDTKGLHFEIDLPPTTAGRDLGALVERGDVAGASFAFQVRPNGDTWEHVGTIVRRVLRDLDLKEITVTADPAYPDTSVAKRHLASFDPWFVRARLYLETCRCGLATAPIGRTWETRK